jgi:hypothetical protein
LSPRVSGPRQRPRSGLHRSAAPKAEDCRRESSRAGSRPRSADAGSRYSSSAPGKAASYEFRRRVWDRVLPTKLRRGAEAVHGPAASSVMASNSFSIARTSGSLFAIRHASTKCRSCAESFSLSALARYLERSRAGTRRTNCSARSSGSVKVIFRVAILPYYHTRPRLYAAGPERLRIEATPSVGLNSPLASSNLRVLGR